MIVHSIAQPVEKKAKWNETECIFFITSTATDKQS